MTETGDLAAERSMLIEDIDATLRRMDGEYRGAPPGEVQVLTLRAASLILRSQAAAAAAPGTGGLVGECFVGSVEAGLKPVIVTDGGPLQWWCVHDPRHTSTC